MFDKNVRKYYLVSLTMLVAFVCNAHQPDLSTAVFSKTKNGKYVLQVSSSLTAFEGEIDFIYKKEAYKTAEEFKELVIQHFEKNVVFGLNDIEELNFGVPIVILGHESKLIVEVLNVPEELESIYFKNTMFKDMPRNRMALIMLADGFPEEQYILENENEHLIELELNAGKWQDATLDKRTLAKYAFYFLMILAGVTATLFFVRKRSANLLEEE